MSTSREELMIFYDLPVGRENAVERDELMGKYGFSSQRKLRDQISHERNDLNLPILNIGSRYFRSDDPKDYMPCIKKILRMGWNTVRTGRTLYKLLPDNSGQITFEEYLAEFVRECAEEEGAGHEQTQTEICSEES